MNKRLSLAYVLSAFNVILIAVSVGLSLYTFIFLPIFFIALFFTIRGNLRGWFVWVGCICSLIYFSSQNISSINSMLRFHFIYNPFVSLAIFISSVIALFIILMTSNTKQITSPLIDRMPKKTTLLLLLWLFLSPLRKAIVDIYGFSFDNNEDLTILFYTSIIRGFFIILHIGMVMSAAFLIIRRSYLGYFLSFLILISISFNWLCNTYVSDPRLLFFGFELAGKAILTKQMTTDAMLSLISNVFYISCFLLVFVTIFRIREKWKSAPE